MLIATRDAALATNRSRPAWFVGFLVLMVYLIFRHDALRVATGGPMINACFSCQTVALNSGSPEKRIPNVK
jgi:hypothetical protein